MLGVDKLAAVRAWTCTPLCYVLCSLVRATDRTPESMAPVLPYARLFFEALHDLPERYVFSGTLYRAEKGAMTTWDAKMRKGGIFSFYVPTSFSRDPSVLKQFKGTGTRTVYKINGASGWILDDFSPYDEKEVLLEPVCHFQVETAEAYDPNHEKVKMGEAEAGLHFVEGHVRPGVPLLDGSRVKKLEVDSYRKWQEQQPGRPDGELELEFDPFTEDEWTSRGKKVPTKDKSKKMSKLGGGGFASTYRKKLASSATSKAQVRRFAVKVVEKEKLEDLGITENDVRREANILGSMRHKNIVCYVGLEETDEEMGIVMELMTGGSIADFIKHTNSQAVPTEKVFEIMMQLASAIDYIHNQGIIHRDVKSDNILFAHAEGSARQMVLKLADFGMAEVLASHAGSAQFSKGGGTPRYFAPERANGESYGAMADMFALGCVLVEICTSIPLVHPIWHASPEVLERRERLFEQVELKHPLLVGVTRGLLHQDKHSRLSAVSLRTHLLSIQRSHGGGEAERGRAPLPSAVPAAPTSSATAALDSMFDINALTRKLEQPQGAHDVLAEACALAQQYPGADIKQLQHCLGRNLAILKNPLVDMRKTLVQLASQEPLGSRLLREAEATLQSLQQEFIEWVNKPRAPLPCVMEIREHSKGVSGVAVSPDGKWIASGSGDNTVKVVEMATGRVKCTLEGHRYATPPPVTLLDFKWEQNIACVELL